jgi:glutamate formiminotransferase
LPAVRRDAFTGRAPDFGPTAPDPRLGAVAVGARNPLVAVNLELDDDNLALARRVASVIRECDGGLPGVRALGLSLSSVGRAQVSMNLVALEATGLETACTAVRELVETDGGSVRRVELVGLAPLAALDACSAEFLAWSGLGADDAIETRAVRATSAPAGSDEEAAAATPGADPAKPA